MLSKSGRYSDILIFVLRVLVFFPTLSTVKKSVSEVFEMQAALCRMMANPKRIAILDLLSRREYSVGELARALSSSVSSISQHLRTMKDQGVVACRREAQTVYYRFRNPRLVEGCHLMREALLEDLARRNGSDKAPEREASAV